MIVLVDSRCAVPPSAVLENLGVAINAIAALAGARASACISLLAAMSGGQLTISILPDMSAVEGAIALGGKERDVSFMYERSIDTSDLTRYDILTTGQESVLTAGDALATLGGAAAYCDIFDRRERGLEPSHDSGWAGQVQELHISILRELLQRATDTGIKGGIESALEIQERRAANLELPDVL